LIFVVSGLCYFIFLLINVTVSTFLYDLHESNSSELKNELRGGIGDILNL